ncbi:MAG: nuclear transport factor 2 family protein [Comamonadaceae bacterium]|nr:MAG: nuclear transport factor 2 family protein [Comamonadaceae bacterium]
MNTLNLPEPIAAYFAAEHNPDALGKCLTTNAVMKDDGHIYTGIDAIKTFMAEVSAKYSATTVPFDLERKDGFQVVRANVAGNFPGSPIVLSYRFQLARGLITSLEVSV